jgi:hypothetical protein
VGGSAVIEPAPTVMSAPAVPYALKAEAAAFHAMMKPADEMPLGTTVSLPPGRNAFVIAAIATAVEL